MSLLDHGLTELYPPRVHLLRSLHRLTWGLLFVSYATYHAMLIVGYATLATYLAINHNLRSQNPAESRYLSARSVHMYIQRP